MVAEPCSITQGLRTEETPVTGALACGLFTKRDQVISEGNFVAMTEPTEQPPRTRLRTEQSPAAPVEAPPGPSTLWHIIQELTHSSPGGASSSAAGAGRMAAEGSSSSMPKGKSKSKTTKKVQAIENESDVLMVRCEEHDVTCGTWPLRGQRTGRLSLARS